MRHLASLDYRLQHEQSALHELDFSVGCMATDLRDGIRLCKLMEVLAGERPPTCALASNPGSISIEQFCKHGPVGVQGRQAWWLRRASR